VTVIRLVAQGTIEEAVLELHGDKRELARGLLEGADNNARLDVSELLRLLQA
jgi:SNF2 family DNA or RNA helicase